MVPDVILGRAGVDKEIPGTMPLRYEVTKLESEGNESCERGDVIVNRKLSRWGRSEHD